MPETTPPAPPTAKPVDAPPTLLSEPPKTEPPKTEPPKTDPPKTDPPKVEDVVVKFPEGVQIDKERMTKFTTLAKEIGLKSDSAQKVADFYVEMERASDQQRVETVTKWAKDAESDKEFGGAAFKENLLTARKALGKIASPELIDLLNDTGLGNHPEVIRLFYKIGKSISEDRLPRSGQEHESEPSLQDQIKEAFPNSPEMWGGKK